jgi:hypothetical protein
MQRRVESSAPIEAFLFPAAAHAREHKEMPGKWADMIRLRLGECDPWHQALSIVQTIERPRRPIIPYPTGRASRCHASRHFTPGYRHSVPTGQTHLPHCVHAHARPRDSFSLAPKSAVYSLKRQLRRYSEILLRGTRDAVAVNSFAVPACTGYAVKSLFISPSPPVRLCFGAPTCLTVQAAGNCREQIGYRLPFRPAEGRGV